MNSNSIIKPPASDMILKKLSHISRVLTEYLQQPNTPNGLMDGKAGIALFFFYYARITGEEKYTHKASKYFDDIFQAIEAGWNDFRFSTGLTGIAWSLLHLKKYKFIEIELDEMLDDLDPFFFKAMTEQFQTNNYYDYLHGALGVGMYWLDRLPNKAAQHYLNHCIHYLNVMWRKISDPKANVKGVNLGTAHGIPSIIAFLSKCLERGVLEANISGLLDRAVLFLLDQTLDPAKYNSHFPYSVRLDRPPSTSRLAWCFGDLGIGTVLWQASQAARNKEWEKKAVQILTKTTTRKALRQNLVVDACFCHGTAGIAHIYNRIYQYTGLEIFKDSVTYWLNQTLKMSVHEDGAAGFKVMFGDNEWQNSYGLLDGIAGIGMALIAYVSGFACDWDGCFLLGTERKIISR